MLRDWRTVPLPSRSSAQKCQAFVPCCRSDLEHPGVDGGLVQRRDMGEIPYNLQQIHLQESQRRCLIVDLPVCLLSADACQLLFSCAFTRAFSFVHLCMGFVLWSSDVLLELRNRSQASRHKHFAICSGPSLSRAGQTLHCRPFNHPTFVLDQTS